MGIQSGTKLRKKADSKESALHLLHRNFYYAISTE